MTQIQENKLPEGWIETTLGEVGKVITGKTPSKDNPEDWGDSVDFITPTDLKNESKYLSFTSRKISELGKKRFTKTIIPQKSIIVTCIGSDMGKVVINSNDCLTNQQINSIVINKNYDVDFIYYKLKDSYNILKNLADGGSTMPILNKSTFEKISLSLPPLPEQQAIAKILSSFDDKIALLREQNETLEKIGQEIFKEWFGKYKVGDELPEGWRVGKLGEVLKFIKGKKPNDTSEIFIDGYIPQILIETFDSGKVTYANPKNTVLISENDLIMVMDGASSGRLEIGYNGIVGSTLSKIEVDEKLKLMIYAFFKSKFKEINDGTTGSSIPHTDKAKIFNFDFFITDENYINDFNKLYGSFLYKILDNKKQIQTLSKTRDELLPKLMKGEVRVV